MTDAKTSRAASRRGFLRAAACGAAAAPFLPALAAQRVVAGDGVQPGGSVLPDEAVGRPFPKGLSLPDAPPAKADGRRTGWAVVGLGDFAIRQVLPALARSERCALRAVVSGNPGKAKRTAAAYGLPDDAIYDYDSFDRIASDDRVDVVYIVLPVGLHAEWTERAFKAGKHVMCEKPMAASPEECERMIAAGKAADRKLMIAYRAHFEPHNVKATQLIRDGGVGTPRTMAAHNHRVLDLSVPKDVWRADLSLSGGGALPDYGIYGLNAACYLSGEVPSEVTAQISTPKDDPRFAEIEDEVTVQLRFPSGFLALLSSSFSQPGVNMIDLFGDQGRIVMDSATSYAGNTLTLHRSGEARSFPGDDSLQFPREVDHLASAVLDGTEILTPGEMGLRDMRLIEAIYRAGREGRRLSLNPDGTVAEG